MLRRYRPGDRDQGVLQPDVAAELERFGSAPQEPVGAGIDQPTAERLAVEGAPWPSL